jgi:aspartyl-tRNA synthetase
VRGLNAGPRDVPRSELDALTETAQRLGAKGLVWAFVEDGGAWRSPVAKFLTPEETAAIGQRLGAGPGDLLLALADRPEVASGVLGALRLELAERFRLVPDAHHDLLWVVDFPMFAWNGDEERWDALHHPFTQPVGSLDDPGSLRSRAYDLVFDGFELAGGSIRNHRLDVQRQVFEAIGIGAEEAQERFGFLLDALRYGAPPHGGIALGLDRLVSLLAGWNTIREVNIRESITFPKTATGQDPLTGAPAPVDARQLRELGLRLEEPPGPPRTWT